LLEIELNENLRRKRNELEGKIEMLVDAPLGGDSDAMDIDARVRELEALESSIERLANELQGAAQRGWYEQTVLTSGDRGRVEG
jgi:structural maintenance of chromosome 3 (chondroitin sulfate proteoglycan 6)